MEAKYETFLTLCKLMNYRETAELMHLTQPAVTRQIQSLEAEFQTKLFVYDHRRLYKTPEAELLENYIIGMRHNYQALKEELRRQRIKAIRVGATKTIGDYVLPDILAAYLREKNRNISLIIDNTETLLRTMREGKLDFAFVEGIFDKTTYASKLLWEEDFVGICAKNHHLAGKVVDIKELFNETLLVREAGSGTRDIFERALKEQGFSLQLFSRCSEISSFKLLTRLVSAGIGISFVYNAVIAAERDIGTFRVKGLQGTHEFNVVWLKGTKITEEGKALLGML